MYVVNAIPTVFMFGVMFNWIINGLLSGRDVGARGGGQNSRCQLMNKKNLVEMNTVLFCVVRLTQISPLCACKFKAKRPDSRDSLTHFSQKTTRSMTPVSQCPPPAAYRNYSLIVWPALVPPFDWLQGEFAWVWEFIWLCSFNVCNVLIHRSLSFSSR